LPIPTALPSVNWIAVLIPISMILFSWFKRIMSIWTNSNAWSGMHYLMPANTISTQISSNIYRGSEIGCSKFRSESSHQAGGITLLVRQYLVEWLET
jgi:hypothetical protein